MDNQDEVRPNEPIVEASTRLNAADLAAFAEGKCRIPEVLNSMGFNGFREGQELPVNLIMAGKDVICILPTGGGKCEAGHTKVLMYAGSIKKIKDVQVGDLLMGDDSTPRKVLAVTKGRGPMFEVTPIEDVPSGDPLLVNKDHVLTLCNPIHTGRIVDISVLDYMNLTDKQKESLGLYRTSVNFDCGDSAESGAYDAGLRTFGVKDTFCHIPAKYKYGSFRTRYMFLSGFLRDARCQYPNLGITWDLTYIHKKVMTEVTDMLRSLGFKVQTAVAETSPKNTHVDVTVDISPAFESVADSAETQTHSVPFTVKEAGIRDYYGFELDGNGRYLHSDFTVTHNSAIFTVPTLAMKWKAIVFSPLTALMRDQVRSLCEKGIAAVQINSVMSVSENIEAIRAWESGDADIMYVAPERIGNDMFLAAMKRTPPQHVILDECIHPCSSLVLNGQKVEAYHAQVGDAILSFNSDKEVEDDVITSVDYKGIRPTYLLKTKRGACLKCTSNEKILTPTRWVYLSNFLPVSILAREAFLRKVCRSVESVSACPEDAWRTRYEKDQKLCDLVNASQFFAMEDTLAHLKKYSDPRTLRVTSSLEEIAAFMRYHLWALWIEFASEGGKDMSHFPMIRHAMKFQVEGVSEESEEAAHKIYTSSEGGLVEDEIEEIIFEGFQPVMDIETKKNHAFVANGIAVHNCHTASQWSDTFRPSYTRIGWFIEEFSPKVVSAFTATAPQACIDDIRRIMGLQNATLYKHYTVRENLTYSSSDMEDYGDLLHKVKKIDGSCIVYCGTRAKTEEICTYLENNGIDATFFHGDVSPPIKRQNQDAFMEGRKRVVCATNAFGMGIDKPDIRGVIHYHIPGSLEAYSQESGRAGRDGKPSSCHLFVNKEGIDLQQFFWRNSNPSSNDIQKVFHFLQKSADADGSIKLSGAEIEKGSNVKGANGVISVLVGANVIARTKPESKIAQIKINMGDADLESVGDERLLFFVEAVRDGGSPIGAGYVDVDMNYVTAHLARKTISAKGVEKSPTTIASWIRGWVTAGYINMVKPFSGKVTTIIGDLSMVEMDRMDAQRADNLKKFNDMLAYTEVPDKDKAQYLLDYFDS